MSTLLDSVPEGNEVLAPRSVPDYLLCCLLHGLPLAGVIPREPPSEEVLRQQASNHKSGDPRPVQALERGGQRGHRVTTGPPLQVFEGAEELVEAHLSDRFVGSLGSQNSDRTLRPRGDEQERSGAVSPTFAPERPESLVVDLGGEGHLD